ncbi:MAG: zinc ribbon domain-containing protein [Bacteroides sp.]|nr:zinc ribbon domain-containing protein [Bacteroides sp.]
MENVNKRYFGPRCPFCGNPLAPGAKKCYHCGYDREQTMKDAKEMGFKGTILCLFLGLLIGWIVIEIFLKH